MNPPGLPSQTYRHFKGPYCFGGFRSSLALANQIIFENKLIRVLHAHPADPGAAPHTITPPPAISLTSKPTPLRLAIIKCTEMPEALPILTEPIAGRVAPSVSSAGLPALLTQAAFAPLPHFGFLRVTGEDRVRWLNGMVTNAISSLTPGKGCYNFFLNAQGRIQADATAFLLEDSILLETAAERIPALVALLDRFIIMDDVELNPLDHLSGLLVAGPHALRTVAALGTSSRLAPPCSAPPSVPEDASAVPSLNLKQTAYAGASVFLIRGHSPLVPRFELWSDPSTIARICDELSGMGAIPASEADLEALRLLEGTPLLGIDIRDKDLPQETALTRALHFAKGCYLGQEIVERIRSRGNVHRTFSGFTLTGEVPPTAAPLFLVDAPVKTVGELTSVVRINLPGSSSHITLALGSIRREALESATQGTSLVYAGGSAKPASLPYRIEL